MWESWIYWCRTWTATCIGIIKYVGCTFKYVDDVFIREDDHTMIKAKQKSVILLLTKRISTRVKLKL